MKTMLSILILGLILTNTYSQVFASNGNVIRKNVSLVNSVEKIYSDSQYSELICEGTVKDSLEEHAIAIAIYTKAIELNKSLPEAFDKRGIANSKLQNYNRAIKDFDMAISLDPKNAVLYNHRAIIYYCMGDFDLALEDYNNSILLKPDFGKAFFNRGLLKIKTEDKQGAVDDLKEAVKLHYMAAQVVLSDISN